MSNMEDEYSRELCRMAWPEPPSAQHRENQGVVGGPLAQ